MVYAAGGIHLNNAPQITVQGAFISSTDIQVNSNGAMNVTYVPSRVIASLGSGTALSVQVKHWEEEY